MNRYLKMVVLLSLLAVFAWPAMARAGTFTISKNNPYKSFNITGINYGSMQWEREHGNKSSSPSRGHRFFRR
jgi:hypothetical protein